MGQEQFQHTTTGYKQTSAANRYGRASPKPKRINEGLHKYSAVTGRYTGDQIPTLLNTIAHKIHDYVNDSGIFIPANIHTTSLSKLMTYRVPSGKNTLIIEFRIGFYSAEKNLKQLRRSESSFCIQGCTLLQSPKSGLNVIHSSTDHHLFHQYTEDLSLSNCPGVDNLESFILGFFKISK